MGKRKVRGENTYMESLQFPTIAQRWTLLHTDPVWYRCMLLGILLEVLTICYQYPLGLDVTTRSSYRFLKVQIIFNILYFVDIFLALMGTFFFQLKYPYPNPVRRPLLIMLLEVISVMPVKYMAYPPVDIALKSKYARLSTLQILKISRFFHHIYNNRRALYNVFGTRLLEMLLILFIVCGIITRIEYLLIDEEEAHLLYVTFELLLCKVVGRGMIMNDIQSEPYLNIFTYELAITFGSMLLWSIIIYPTVCFMIMSLIEANQHRYDYTAKVTLFKRIIVPKYKLIGDKYKMLMNYFESHWRLRGGFTVEDEDPPENINQFALKVEVAMDYSWAAFQHCYLFKDVELCILRYLSISVRKNMRMEGEYIFQKNRNKPGMVYIASGVIEVLSFENMDAGIISLTSGTCIGTASLVYPHASPVDFRCKTICELYELDRNSFLSIATLYPKEYKQLSQKVLERIRTARMLKKSNSKYENSQTETTRIVWIKHNLHRYQSLMETYEHSHKLNNIFLKQILDYRVRSESKIKHTLTGIDSLALVERISSDNDLVFVRTSCPWILKPNSPITFIWECIIVALSVLVTITVTWGFCMGYTEVVNLLIIIITIFFIFDIVIQVITPVDIASTSRSLPAVIGERFKTKGFLLDMISIFHWKIIYFVINTDKPWYDLLKLIKLWRVYRFFNLWSDKFLVNIYIHRIALAIALYATSTYTISWLFKLSGITESIISPISIQFGTGVGLNFFDNRLTKKYSYMYIVANYISLVVEGMSLAMICSSSYLMFLKYMQIINKFHVLRSYVKSKETPWLYTRLTGFLNTQLNDNHGVMAVGNISQYFRLPKYFESVMKSNVHLETLKQIEFLEGLPMELINKLLLKTEIITWNRHSRVISRGMVFKDVLVIIKGSCRTLMGGYYHGTRLMQPLNILEACYKLPVTTTVVALSEVMLLKFDFESFRRLLSEHHKHFADFNRVVEETKPEFMPYLLELLYGPLMEVRSLNMGHRSVKCFAFFATRNSYQESTYHIPFDTIKPFDFIKYFLMRMTFYPEGRFLRFYEFQRCLMAYTSSIVFTIPALNIGAFVNRSGAFPLMLFLDLMAVLDIYIRMHVCYYDDNGILITHPLRTAKHYLSRSFLIDLLGVFPFDIFPMKVHYRVVLNAVHSFQIYRIAALKQYYSQYYSYYITNTIFALCCLLFAANFVAGILYVYDCYEWNNEEMVPPVDCKIFKYPNTEAHFHILFTVMSALCISGMNGVIKVTDLDNLLTIIVCSLCFIGVFASILQRSYIFSCYINKRLEKYKFIIGVRKLLSLMKAGRDNKHLQKEVAFYYDTYWNGISLHNPENLTHRMTKALRRDLLFRFYGNSTVQYSMFTTTFFKTSQFIKNVMLHANRLIIPKNGYLITINDIEENIYVLNTGNVDILAADGTKLTTLCEGSIFGNIENAQYLRQKVSVVANVNIEVLCLKSLNFYNLIQYFPAIWQEFEVSKRRYMYYVRSKKLPEPILTMTVDQYIKATKRYGLFQILHIFQLFYGCYLGLLVELYQLAVGEMHWVYLIVQYSMDLVHLVHEFLKFKVPYKDEHRAPIFDPYKIVDKQISKRTELIMTCITVIYLDLFLVVPTFLYSRYTLIEVSYHVSLLRLNRLLKIYYIYKSYERRQERISQCSKIIAKWFTILYYVFLSYQCVAALTAILDSRFAYTTSNVIHNIDGEKISNLRRLPPKEKLFIYIKYLYFSNLIHIMSGDRNYGPKTLGFNIYVIILYLYAMVVNAIALCKYFEAMMELGEMRRHMFTFNSYLNFYCAQTAGSFVIKERILDNCEHVWAKKYYKTDTLLKTNSPRYLREAVMNNLYGYLFARHRVLGHTHIDFLRQLGLHYNLVVYPCDSVIVYKNDHRTCMFFVNRGEVAVYDQDYGYRDIAVDVLTKGYSFGLLQGLNVAKRFDYTYITLKHSEIVELEWDTWNYLLDFFPATKEYIFRESHEYDDMPALPLEAFKPTLRLLTKVIDSK